MAKYYNYVLQGHAATEENAYNAIRRLNWQEIRTDEADYPNMEYVDTVNGIGIYYNHGHDAYYFTDEPEEEGNFATSEEDMGFKSTHDMQMDRMKEMSRQIENERNEKQKYSI